MPTFKLNGREIPFTAGDTIMVAAWRAGIEIPHYCWHPGLSVAANCRMCLVEITSARPMMMPILRWDERKKAYVPEVKPKLQPACQMAAQEGMDVSSVSAEAQKAQDAVQEFLLLNHPVDCPICDQSGECKLQDYWLAHQHRGKRKLTEPVHKPKGVRFGPTIVYDAERCIMCTRCIRVCDELAKDHALDMRQRGNKNEIVLAPGRELDHRYTLMTEHVCPVGALTSRDFRFKARVWFLRSAPGVCNGCATGCNSHVDFDPRNGRVYRLRPRDNEHVNEFWMCDDGMMTYKEVHENRVLLGLVGRGDERAEMPPAAALSMASTRLTERAGAKVGVVLSARASTEDNYALLRFAKDVLGTPHVFLTARGGWTGDDILRHSDDNANRAGVMALAGAAGLKPMASLLKSVETGEVEAAVVLGVDAAEPADRLMQLAALDTVVCLASNHGILSHLSTFVIPVASWAETSGSYTNAKGLVQRFEKAIAPPSGVKPAWQVLVEMAARMGRPLPLSSLTELRAAISSTPANTAAQPEVRA